VRYYIYAADNDGNESWYPVKPTTQSTPNVEFYTVRDNGMMVYDIQYTLNPNGSSPLAGQEVTVKGIVTSSTKIGDLGYLYIQDETGSAWSGIWCVGIGLNTYYRNEEVEITGVVEEYYGMTRLNVTSSSKTGNLGTVAPTILDPSDSASYANFGWEPYEGVYVRYELPAGQLAISQTNLGFGDWAVSSSNTADVSHSGRVLVGRQSTTAYSSLDAQLVTDTIYGSLDGEMNVSPIVVSDTMTFDAIEGILFYGFSNYRLVPRNNNDFIGANLTLDSVYVPTSPLNIVELGQSTWTYYPNPVRDLLTVETTTSGTVQLFNAQGRIVHSTDFNAQARIDVSALPTGMYILKLQAAEGVKSARIFIQH
jgi:predicted extracellular nuclease